MKTLTVDERIELVNGAIEKDMIEWQIQSANQLFAEYRTYRFVSRGWYGNVEDEQMHKYLDRHEVAREMSEEDWAVAPRKILEIF